MRQTEDTWMDVEEFLSRFASDRFLIGRLPPENQCTIIDWLLEAKGMAEDDRDHALLLWETERDRHR